ncbi:hypothetical protein AWN76_009185 [Rhodothermaceae bacterium RA]|nr:hypothetical protein AWN76_009185 [Rhodothermaceae bacterium RA]
MKLLTNKAIGNLAYHAISKFIYVIGTFVAVKIIVSQTDAEGYGAWTQIMISVRMLVPVVLLQLHIALVRFYESDEFSARRMWFSLVLFVWFMNLILFLAGLYLDDQLSILVFGDTGFESFVPLLFALLATETTFMLLSNYIRAENRIRAVSNFQLSRNLLQLAALYMVLYHFNANIIDAVKAYVYVDLLVILVVFASILLVDGVRIELPGGEALKALWVYLRYSLPLVPHVFMLWVINQSDRYFLAHYFDLEVVGVYNAMYLFGTIVSVMQLTFNFVVYPQSVKLWENNRRIISLRYNGVMGNIFFVLGSFLVTIIWLVGPDLLVIIGNESFRVSRWTLAILSVGYLLSGSDQFIRNLIHLYRKTSVLPKVFLVASLTNLVLNFILIPRLGIEGAVYSTVLTFLAQYLLLLRIGRLLGPTGLSLGLSLSLFWQYALRVLLYH